MKKSILTFALAFTASFSIWAQADLTAAEEAKAVHRLFQNMFAPSCAALPQLAICDFSLQNEILVVNQSAFDQATLAVTTIPSVHSEIAARKLSEKYNFDYQTALRSAATLEAWVKRIQMHNHETSRAEFEAVYFSTVGVSQSSLMQMMKSQDPKQLEQIAETVSQKFKVNSRDAKLFLENILANEPAQ